jgi:hypothetical protein
MGLITNEAEFISYVRRMLGNPVINVEVADVNISDCIYDSIQQFQRYNIGEGSVRDVLAISLSANVSAYDLSGMDIDAVLDIQLTNQIYNINTLFSPTHMLLYNQFQNGAMTGATVNGGVANLGGSGVLGNYMIQMMYLSEIQEMFQRKYVCDFDTGSQRLKIRPTPNQDDVGVLMVFKKESAINLYNHPLVKQLVIAKVKKIWGNTLGKYSISLPGQGNLTGSDIRQQGIDEEKEALENMRLEGDSPIMMVG